MAIWSNLELFIAIITANLALSRSIFLHFYRKHSSPNASRASPYYETSAPRRSGSTRNPNHSRRMRGLFDMSLGSAMGRSQQLTGRDAENNHMTSDCRRASSSHSMAGSEIPLEPQIRKKTEFYVLEEAESTSDGAIHIEGDAQKIEKPAKAYGM